MVLGADVGWGESSPGAGARSGDLVKTWRRCGRNRERPGRRRGGSGRGGEAHVSAMIETTMPSGTCSPHSMSTLLRQAPLMIFIALIDAYLSVIGLFCAASRLQPEHRQNKQTESRVTVRRRYISRDPTAPISGSTLPSQYPRVPEWVAPRVPARTRQCPRVPESTREYPRVPESTYPRVPDRTRQYPDSTRQYPTVPESNETPSWRAAIG